MQLRPREKTRETLRFSRNKGPVIKRLLLHHLYIFVSPKINFKKAPLHDEYCIVHFSDFFEGDRAFLVWKKWSILVKKWKPYVQKPNT